MKRTLLIGYGNPDREDDGVAWHVLRALAVNLGLPAPDSYEDEFPTSDRLDFTFSLQLTPEMAEEIAAYDRVCFVDAHTGNIPVPVQMLAINGEFQQSPFTHHLTAQSLLSICQALYESTPEAVLLSIRGHQFGFERELSARTASLVPQAVGLIEEWLKK
ncbi:MAG: hydrogenase maturation protease [Chloroflexota bacterium]